MSWSTIIAKTCFREFGQLSIVNNHGSSLTLRMFGLEWISPERPSYIDAELCNISGFASSNRIESNRNVEAFKTVTKWSYHIFHTKFLCFHAPQLWLNPSYQLSIEIWQINSIEFICIFKLIDLYRTIGTATFNVFCVSIHLLLLLFVQLLLSRNSFTYFFSSQFSVNNSWVGRWVYGSQRMIEEMLSFRKCEMIKSNSSAPSCWNRAERYLQMLQIMRRKETRSS